MTRSTQKAPESKDPGASINQQFCPPQVRD